MTCFNYKQTICIRHNNNQKKCFVYRYIMFGRGICEKYQSRDEQFPERNGEGNLVSRKITRNKTESWICYLHAEQRHTEPFQDWIKLKKWLKLFSVLKWFGRSFHRVAAANMNDFLPYLVVLTNMFEYLKAYLEFFTLTKSWRHTGANLLTILYVSKAIVLIRMICKEGTRAFSRRLIYELV